MQGRRWIGGGAVLLLTAVSGCGGSSQSQDSQAGGSGPSYAWIPPTVGATATYLETTIDNSNNRIQQTFTETVTGVNPDGSFTEQQQGEGNQSAIVDGTNFSVLTETIELDDSGRTTSYTYTNAAGLPETCVEAPHGLGPSFPLVVGASWSLSYSLSCNGGTPISYTQQGTIEPAESVTVAAGTYSAIKLESTVVWTLDGTTHTETLSNWRDVVTLTSVKQTYTIAISGAVPTAAYAVSVERDLQTAPP